MPVGRIGGHRRRGGWMILAQDQSGASIVLEMNLRPSRLAYTTQVIH